jgi:class 3 adenylate cyclase
VNTASRVEGLTKELHVPVVVSQATRDAAAGAYRFEELGSSAVKGKAQKLRLYSPVVDEGTSGLISRPPSPGSAPAPPASGAARSP